MKNTEYICIPSSELVEEYVKKSVKQGKIELLNDLIKEIDKGGEPVCVIKQCLETIKEGVL